MIPIDKTAAVGFAMIALGFIVTPGVGFVLFSSTMLVRGRRAALGVGMGIIAGAFTLVSLVILAYPLLIAQVSQLRPALRLIGGAYLILLGAQKAWGAFRKHDEITATGLHKKAVNDGYVLQGALSSLSNPGLLVLYLVVLPTFVAPSQPWRPSAAVLAIEHLSLATAWYAMLFFAIGMMRSLLKDSAQHRTIDIVSAMLLVGFGVRTLFF